LRKTTNRPSGNQEKLTKFKGIRGFPVRGKSIIKEQRMCVEKNQVGDKFEEQKSEGIRSFVTLRRVTSHKGEGLLHRTKNLKFLKKLKKNT
jgi:hypothetical protein